MCIINNCACQRVDILLRIYKKITIKFYMKHFFQWTEFQSLWNKAPACELWSVSKLLDNFSWEMKFFNLWALGVIEASLNISKNHFGECSSKIPWCQTKEYKCLMASLVSRRYKSSKPIKLSILDPRSQRKGSYKFGAVIVNV